MMVRIKDLLQEDLVIDEITAVDKDGVLKEFGRLLKTSGRVQDEEDVVRVLTEREALGSTGIGDGVAIPHGKMEGLRQMIVAFGRSRKGVEFQALDGMPVFLFFLLLTPLDRPGEHLKALARISRILKNPLLRERLRNGSGQKELHRLIIEEDGKYSQP